MADINHTPLPSQPPLPPPPKPPSSFSPSPEAAPIRMEQPIQPEAATEDSGEELPLQEAHEHEIDDPDVQQYVQQSKDSIKISQELQNLGLKAVNQTSFPNYQNIKLPMSDDQVMKNSNAPMNTSVRWLAEYAKLLLWRAHISLKTIQGKVVRVVKR